MANEERLNPETFTLKELEYSHTDGRWKYKVHQLDSEGGAALSMGTASTANLTSQVTKTDLLTGKGTLTSAGIKFILKEVLVSATKKAQVSIHDGTTCTGANKKADVIVTSGSFARVEGIYGARFSSAVRVKATTGDVVVHVGGIRYILSI